MYIISQLITSFISSALFGFVFNAPKRLLLQCGTAGMACWMVYIIGIRLDLDIIPATLIAATLVTIISQWFAKLYKTPIIVFNVPGIIPLVPGGIAYDAMKNVVLNQYDTAVQLAVKAFMISGSIAIGLVLSEVINQVIRRSIR